MSGALTLFRDLPPMPEVSGTCCACRRKVARMAWTTTDKPETGGAVSSVFLCDGCARIVDTFTLARDQAHEVARRAAARREVQV